jgi:hypothetical protein
MRAFAVLTSAYSPLRCSTRSALDLQCVLMDLHHASLDLHRIIASVPRLAQHGVRSVL